MTFISIFSCSDKSNKAPSFSVHIVDDDIHGTASLHACDLDNDGDVDILGAVLEEDAIVYWRNDGGKPIVWKREIIDNKFQRAISVYPADVDGDKDFDVVGASAGPGEISLWINEGNDPIQWKKQIIRQDYLFAHEVYAHDLDLDGDIDILGASTMMNRLSWWQNIGDNPIVWVEQTIDSSFMGAKSVRVADFDNDSDLDVVGAALDGNEVAWWSNNDGNPNRWRKYSIDREFYGAHRVQAVDMDDDGDVDILAASYEGNTIAWWENRRGNPVQWEKHIIAEGFQRACIAQAIDLDKDGDKDIIGTAQDGNEVAWWRNESRGDSITWTKCHIDSLQRVWPLYVCDLDGDRDMDIIAGSGWKGINQVKLYENNAKTVKIAGIILKWIPKKREENYQRSEKLIRKAASMGAKIVCTTESFLDGYSIRDDNISDDEFRSLAEQIPGGKYVTRMQKLIEELDIYLIAGITEQDGKKIYNSAIIISPEGKIIGKYRKKFLWGVENDKYTPGEQFPVFSTSYGKIGMMICSDRRQPESIKELTKNGTEIVFCLAGGGFGKENDQIISQRSKEGKVPIIFVHPVEFLITGTSGEILEKNFFGTELDDNEQHTIGGVVRLFDLHL